MRLSGHIAICSRVLLRWLLGNSTWPQPPPRTGRGTAGRSGANLADLWPKIYELVAVLVPAALAIGQPVDTDAAAKRLRDACIPHLRARIAELLAPADDWTRAATLTCQCRDCAELSLFLADPTRQT